MATFITKRKVQFRFFDHQLGSPDWTGKRVLDFGGNAGNVLLDPNCQIEPGNYWCIDLSRDAIAEGRRRHPEAHFIFYDRYNFEYNPTGTIGLPIPDPGIRFDFIVAWSVVTHNNKADSLKLIDQLVALLADDGKLAVTFTDPTWTPPPIWSHESTSLDLSRLDEILMGIKDYKPEMDAGTLQAWAEKTDFEHKSVNWSNLHWALEKMHAAQPEMDVAKLLEQAEKTTLTWIAVVNGDELVVEPDGDELPEEDSRNPVDHRLFGYLNFCTAEFMGRLYPNAQIRPPVKPDRMHCAIIGGRRDADHDAP